MATHRGPQADTQARIGATRARPNPVPPVRKTERGASEIFILLLMTTMLGFAGLAYDAGMAFNARRHATNVAAAAARDGANQVESDALYTVGTPLLDSSRATSVARSRVNAAGLEVVRVGVNLGIEMHVEVRAVHRTTFLQVIGIDTLTVTAESKVLAENLANS